MVGLSLFWSGLWSSLVCKLVGILVGLSQSLVKVFVIHCGQSVVRKLVRTVVGLSLFWSGLWSVTVLRHWYVNW